MSDVTIVPATITGQGTMVWTIKAVCAQRPIHRHVSTATAGRAGVIAAAAATRDLSTT